MFRKRREGQVRDLAFAQEGKNKLGTGYEFFMILTYFWI